ncbi:MAG: threonylcarbamoyl-AMP synthase [Sphingobacteriales bacterium]|nr:threonylcarbamoyl-AMP synthase [Sphingobacteriales bacterium]MCC7224475.1 threonylcarbamoyl-AMP synthase [Chitinophagales bacterium]
MTHDIEQACAVLQAGGIILYPTDTVWGLGCDATQPEAVERIYALKRRKDSKALIVLVPDIAALQQYIGQLPPNIAALLAAVTRPTTIVYPNVQGVAHNLKAPDGSVAIRLPQHDFCQALLRQYGKPIVSTSANLSGERPADDFKGLNPAIIAGSQWVAPQHYENSYNSPPSTILRITVNGTTEVIRA